MIVHAQLSALDLYGSLKPKKKFPGAQAEKEALRRSIGKQAAEKGMQ